MADLKSIAKMQIGGPKYPDKKRINLYQREFKKSKIAAQLLCFAVFMVAVHFFVLFGVRKPLQEAESAELIYQKMEKQLESIQRANNILPEVQAEYAHYGNSWQSDEERAIPDRLNMTEVIKNRVFPLCDSVEGLTISGDYADFNCMLEKGSMLSGLVRQIEEDETVRYVTASLESTGDPAIIDSRLALNKKVLAHVTVYFKMPGESEEAS